ncbi:MAG: nucleoside triphosphate pyrophosphohydrolase [Bacteroidetes bacterium]|nr:nucleoside triphosphate pyrophosphohydrolase [Bacteroidota bacterium]
MNSTNFQNFVNIVRTLRKQCPWDSVQTSDSLRQSFLEEAYEVVESISTKQYNELKEELGDLLLHIVLQSIIAEERGLFTLDDVITSITTKMINRHPHVFGTHDAKSVEDVKQYWEEQKIAEGRESLLDGIPHELPALMKAQRVQERASKAGFDWKEKSEVWKKVEEEVTELKRAETSKNQHCIEEEFGDLLFALVNYSRFINVSSELALQSATRKFMQRFKKIEETLKRQGKSVFSASFEEMDAIWNEQKYDSPAPKT